MHVAPLFYIYTAISNLLTNSCIRKYAELEELMCLGCHPYESSYINGGKRVVYICNAFAMKMWNASTVEELSSGSRKYDNCGFKITSNLAKAVNPSRHYIIRLRLLQDFFIWLPQLGFRSMKIMKFN